MKIVRFTAENVKRLKAVEIEPDGTLQVITGRNAQGKSSVLDAIWLALGGGAASRGTVKPVRDGEESAIVKLDLGDLRVTRSWNKSGNSTLKVESADGAQFKSPQSMLDGLVGSLSFDPLEFTRKSGREQVEALLSLTDLDLDLDAHAVEVDRIYSTRTQIGRDANAFGQIGINESLPTVEERAGELIEQIQTVKDNARVKRSREIEIEQTAQRIEELKTELEARRAELEESRNALNGIGELPDTTELEARLATIEETNAAIRANNVNIERAKQQSALEADYKRHTEMLAELDRKKADALAKATFPVDGLGFDETGVTYQGVPFSQASSAEQIRVSLGMAMALNPDLRVIRILDGSLVDADGMKQIAELAAAGDFQVWIERVEDSSESAVVIEDGQVAE